MGKTTPTPLTNAQKVKKCQAGIVANGGKRLPDGYLKREAAQALESLLSAGYADSRIGVISAAILDAQKKMQRAQK